MADRDPMMGMLASLVAAVSILEEAAERKCSPQKIAASDAVFKLMIRDYKKAIRLGREAIKAQRGEV